MKNDEIEIELINADDFMLAEKHKIKSEDIRRITVKAAINSEVWFMAINESIQEVLQLPFMDKRKVSLTDEKIIEHDIVGPMLVKFNGQTALCSAFVLSDENAILLGMCSEQQLLNPANKIPTIKPLDPKANYN